MSERKSAEIKFRCTPSFKASVATSAEAAGQSMSEYIEAAVGRQSAATEVSGVRAVALTPDEVEELLCPKDDAADGPPVDIEVAVMDVDLSQFSTILESIGHPDSAACACRPWEFCTHKATG